MIPDDVKVLNAQLFEQLTTPGQEKYATDTMTEFTRTEVRERGLQNRIIPPETVNDSDLVPQQDTDMPVLICEMQPDSPGAVTVPFGTSGPEWYLSGRRYRVHFVRIVTPLVRKDIEELRTYRYDIRQVISDQMINDMLAHEDSRFFGAVNSALIGADQVVPNSGVIQWETIYGGIDRDTLWEAKKIMPRADAHLTAATAVINNVTINEVAKQDRTEWGGDGAESMMKSGWTEEELQGMKLIVTIKRYLVPDNSIYFFGDPRFIGKNCVLTDTTMHVDRKEWMISFRLSKVVGTTIANTGGLARADFA